MKYIVITGASRGIGKAIAIKFAKENYKLALASRNENNLKELSKELQQFTAKENFFTFSVDVSKVEQVKRFAKKVFEFGSPDILVNNAGLFKLDNILGEKENYLEEHMQVNLFGAFNLTKIIAPKMIENASGHIFNICSVASKKPFANCSTYSISKFAMYGFSQALREELKPHNVKVSSILPGATMSDSWNGVEIEEKRIMEAADIANTIFAIYNLAEQTVVEEIVMRPMLGDL